MYKIASFDYCYQFEILGQILGIFYIQEEQAIGEMNKKVVARLLELYRLLDPVFIELMLKTRLFSTRRVLIAISAYDYDTQEEVEDNAVLAPLKRVQRLYDVFGLE